MPSTFVILLHSMYKGMHSYSLVFLQYLLLQGQFFQGQGQYFLIVPSPRTIILHFLQWQYFPIFSPRTLFSNIFCNIFSLLFLQGQYIFFSLSEDNILQYSFFSKDIFFAKPLRRWTSCWSRTATTRPSCFVRSRSSWVRSSCRRSGSIRLTSTPRPAGSAPGTTSWLGSGHSLLVFMVRKVVGFDHRLGHSRMVGVWRLCPPLSLSPRVKSMYVCSLYVFMCPLRIRLTLSKKRPSKQHIIMCLRIYYNHNMNIIDAFCYTCVQTEYTVWL